MKIHQELLAASVDEQSVAVSLSSQGDFSGIIAAELALKLPQVQIVEKLLNGGGTIPFIARYRKEATGFLDEVVITNIRDQLERLAELEKRRQAILKSLVERRLLTKILEKTLLAASTLVELEDLYLPYRPKRRTRALLAREKGLEPLAKLLLAENSRS